MTEMLVVFAAVFIVVPIVIGIVIALLLRSARRKDGTIEWKKLGNGDM